MNITYLREFMELGLSLNFSKAAKRLHVSQPSLSKHIAALEQECETQLLKRSASRVELTLAGRMLFEESWNLLRIHDETLRKIKGLKSMAILNVSGLFNNSTAISIINRALADLNKGTKRLSVSYQDYRHQSYRDLLKKDAIDIAITILSETEEMPKTFERAFLFEDPMVCLVKEGHPFAAKDNLNVRDLQDQVILQPVGSYSTEHGRSTVKDIFARYDISPLERPAFVHSISEFSTIVNEECVLIMEESMLRTQPFTNDYRVLRFKENDARFMFFAVYSKAAKKLEDIECMIHALTKAAGAGSPA